MSLYDKYHSNHNKTYMFNLISNIVSDEYNINIKQNETYQQFFETNFINTFQTITSEDLADFNQHLLDTQINYVRDFLIKDKHVLEPSVPEIKNSSITLQSYERKIHLTQSSRFSYRIQKPDTQTTSFELDKVIVPIEDSPLFSTYRLGILLNSNKLDLYLRGTIKVRERIYGIYCELSETKLSLPDPIITVQWTNWTSSIPITGDVFKIQSTKPNKLLVQADIQEFQTGDYIRLCNLDSLPLDDSSCLTSQYKVLSVRPVEDSMIELKITTPPQVVDGFYVMNMSLQHTLHLI